MCDDQDRIDAKHDDRGPDVRLHVEKGRQSHDDDQDGKADEVDGFDLQAERDGKVKEQVEFQVDLDLGPRPYRVEGREEDDELSPVQQGRALQEFDGGDGELRPEMRRRSGSGGGGGGGGGGVPVSPAAPRTPRTHPAAVAVVVVEQIVDGRAEKPQAPHPPGAARAPLLFDTIEQRVEPRAGDHQERVEKHVAGVGGARADADVAQDGAVGKGLWKKKKEESRAREEAGIVD